MTEMDLLKIIGTVEDVFLDELYRYTEEKTRSRRPKLILLAAVIAALLFALTAGAVGLAAWEDGSWFESYFARPDHQPLPGAITDHQQELLDAGLVQIGQTMQQDGYTITLVSALCDGHRLLAKLLVEAPEGVVLEPGRYDLITEYAVHFADGTKVPFGAATWTCRQLEDIDPTDGQLQFLLDVRMQPKSETEETMRLGVEWEIFVSELHYAYSREEEYWRDPLATGKWAFTIPFDSASLLTQETEVLEKPVWIHAARYWGERSFPVDLRVTSLRIRSMSATLSYDKPFTGFWDGIDMGDIYIVMKDGTKILAHWDMGHNKGSYWQDTLTFPVPIAREDIDYVLLPNGDQIPIQ